MLLKSILILLSNYFLSFFKTPSSIVPSIESLFTYFLWSGSEVDKKIYWIKWEKVCIGRANGELGVRRIKIFNLLKK